MDSHYQAVPPEYFGAYTEARSQLALAGLLNSPNGPRNETLLTQYANYANHFNLLFARLNQIGQLNQRTYDFAIEFCEYAEGLSLAIAPLIKANLLNTTNSKTEKNLQELMSCIALCAELSLILVRLNHARGTDGGILNQKTYDDLIKIIESEKLLLFSQAINELDNATILNLDWFSFLVKHIDYYDPHGLGLALSELQQAKMLNDETKNYLAMLAEYNAPVDSFSLALVTLKQSRMLEDENRMQYINFLIDVFIRQPDLAIQFSKDLTMLSNHHILNPTNFETLVEERFPREEKRNEITAREEKREISPQRRNSFLANNQANQPNLEMKDAKNHTIENKNENTSNTRRSH